MVFRRCVLFLERLQCGCHFQRAHARSKGRWHVFSVNILTFYSCRSTLFHINEAYVSHTRRLYANKFQQRMLASKLLFSESKWFSMPKKTKQQHKKIDHLTCIHHVIYEWSFFFYLSIGRFHVFVCLTAAANVLSIWMNDFSNHRSSHSLIN